MKGLCPDCGTMHKSDEPCPEIELHCPDCQAVVNDDGVSIDERCCDFCKAD